MKAASIVRRVDDLGRIVLPKEIRKSLRSHEGDTLLNDGYLWATANLHKRLGQLAPS